MELLEAITTRRSCRSFKSDVIPREILEKVLESAGRSPSSENTQPWEVAVVTGNKKEELSRILSELANSKTIPNHDIPKTKIWPPELDKRAKEDVTRKLEFLDIEQSNELKRNELRSQNFVFYNAPCVMFLFMDKALASRSILDIGLFIQSLVLAIRSFGLESCLQASIANYPDKIREFLGIPNTKSLVIGISLGYPDTESKINQYQSSRVNISDFVKWYD